MSIDKTVAGQTLATSFLATVRESGPEEALRWKNEDGSFGCWTFDEYADLVARVAGGLQKLGVGRGDRLVLMLRNIPEFHIIDTAAYFLGAAPVSIYNSSSESQIEYLADHCEAKLAFVEDARFLDRFRPVLSKLPKLESLGSLRDHKDGEFSWEDLISADPIDLQEAAKTAQPEDLATMIYTSGTTGPPKGVMLSHYNLCWTIESLRITIGWESYRGVKLVSYLPMAHIAERMVGHYQQLAFGCTVTTCPEPTQVADYAREVRPTYFFGVPRIWEKMYAGINAALAADPERKAKFTDAIEAAIPLQQRITDGSATDQDRETWNFLDQVAFSQVRALIGMDECKLAVTGAAPIPPEMMLWFRALGVPLAEIYGMSESSGPITFSPWVVRAGSVGQAVPGCEVRLADDGEVICRGGNVFQGYLKEEAKTAEALDSEGWLHSGDIGEIDADGYLRIVDRKKELLITAGGKNISPSNLESSLKMIPLIGQACAIGDGKPFVSALVVLDPDAAGAWAAAHDMAGASLEELAKNPEIVAELEAAVESSMASFNNAERVKRISILGEEWLPDSDLLTPTSKLKRRGIHEKYHAEIEALYTR